MLAPVAGAQKPSRPSYGCALASPTTIATADGLAAGGWTSSGAFDDSRPVGIDAKRNRILVKHGALDVVGASGAAVLAMRGGQVALVASWLHLGNTVIIDHGDGNYSVYAFLGSVSVREGAAIARSAALGTIGFSGDAAELRRGHPAAAPRLHLAVLSAARPGLAAPGQPLRRLGAEVDAWTAQLDAVAKPMNPQVIMPASCIAVRAP